jgi:opacity protein-like surface antigen
MRHPAWIVFGALILSAGPVLADDAVDGMPSQDRIPLAGWQGRVSLGSHAAPWQLGVEFPASKVFGPSLMGDYYFGPALTGAGVSGGLRATSGLIMGSHGVLGSSQTSLTLADPFSASTRALGARAVPLAIDPNTDTTTLPYLGLGYSGLSVRSGWSFSADLGLVAQSASSALRYGRGLGSGPTLDDAVRDMRLAPVLQFAVSYSF